MPFHGNSHINVLSEDIIKLLKDTGCEYLAMGIESGNEHIRKKILIALSKLKSEKHTV